MSHTVGKHMEYHEVIGLSTRALRSMIASTNPRGTFAEEVAWAKQELERRGVDYSDCLGGD